jgi:hypothetical protein
MVIYIGSLVIIIGWFVAYFFGKRQNVINKQREVRIHYLINAWQLIERVANRKDNELNKNLEIAVAEIQLFGSKKQIELVQKFAEEFANNSSGNVLGLLIDLRKDLRKELNLEEVPDEFKFLRV